MHEPNFIHDRLVKRCGDDNSHLEPNNLPREQERIWALGVFPSMRISLIVDYFLGYLRVDAGVSGVADSDVGTSAMSTFFTDSGISLACAINYQLEKEFVVSGR